MFGQERNGAGGLGGGGGGVFAKETLGVKLTKVWADEGRSELSNCVRVEVDVLGSPFLIVRSVSVDVKQH